MIRHITKRVARLEAEKPVDTTALDHRRWAELQELIDSSEPLRELLYQQARIAHSEDYATCQQREELEKKIHFALIAAAEAMDFRALAAHLHAEA